jgi:ATP-dependent DNA helicase RecG
MPVITLDDNNRLNLPPELIERLGLKPGSRLNVEADGEGRLVLTPIPVPAPAPPAPSTFREAVQGKNLATPLQFIKGAGPKLAEALARKGLNTAEDALYLLPNRYEDRRELKTVARLRAGFVEVFHAEVLSADAVATRGGRRFFEAIVGRRPGNRGGRGSSPVRWPSTASKRRCITLMWSGWPRVKICRR